jgi:Smr domain/Domain of unknown function (DUF2027)
MLFAKGSRVRLNHTGDEGTVTDLLDNGMVNVLLDDGDEIPVFEEDLTRIEDYRAVLSSKPPVKAKVVKGPSEKRTPQPDRPQAQPQYSILKSLGIQLAFEPRFRLDGSTEKYNIHLINDTKYAVLFTFSLYLGKVLKLKSNGKIDSATTFALGELLFDYLNEGPEVQFECWQVTTLGTGKKLSKTLKIKPQQFFKKVRTAPILNLRVHHYILFENLDDLPKKEEDLQTYTKRNSRPLKYTTNSGNFDKHDVSELANFIPEIDLHINSLTSKYEGLSNAEKIRIQLHHFDEFIEKGIRLGVPRVFVIHGLGKGKLRDEIATRLLQNPDVETFKNEFHPRYGFGATEVVFGD